MNFKNSSSNATIRELWILGKTLLCNNEYQGHPKRILFKFQNVSNISVTIWDIDPGQFRRNAALLKTIIYRPVVIRFLKQIPVSLSFPPIDCFSFCIHTPHELMMGEYHLKLLTGRDNPGNNLFNKIRKQFWTAMLYEEYHWFSVGWCSNILFLIYFKSSRGFHIGNYTESPRGNFCVNTNRPPARFLPWAQVKNNENVMDMANAVCFSYI